MQLLHLSDLHIGRRLNGLSLMEDQRDLLKQMLTMAQPCDGVLIAGDLFDKSQPSAEAIKAVSDFLVALNQLGKPTFVISGNHDNAEQLSYCRELLGRCGVYISPVFDGQLRSFPLTDQWGSVHFWLLPFLKPANVRPFYPEVNSYEDAIAAVLNNAPINTAERNILLCHQYVSGSAICESESRMIGGLDQISNTVFAPFDYVALGHLHSPQQMAQGRICYAGSPMKYSLSEEHQHKAALKVTLAEKGSLRVEKLPFVPRHDLRTLRGTLTELIAQPSDDYLYAILTDEGALLDPIGSLRLSFPNLLGMRIENSRTQTEAVFTDIQRAEGRSPLEHFIDFYKAQHNDQPPTERQLAVLREILEETEAADHEAH